MIHIEQGRERTMPWIPLRARAWRFAWALRRSALRSKPLDPEALERWAQFYGEEDGGAPKSLEDFAKALFRNGIPDVGNPFPQGDERHYQIHPGGFLSGEVERALRPPETEADEARAKNALDRIGLLLDVGCRMLSARAYWADEDIHFACALSLAEGGWERAGAQAPRAILFAMEERLIEAPLVPGLLIARKLIEAAKYPPPWARKKEKGGRRAEAADEESETPPPADVGRWRLAREAARSVPGEGEPNGE